ncbi:prepilin peptidase [Lentisphaera araneosa HTCC2155]|uniref:Prepilin peptidase n=1 Tax=Lentisphaera araneosa HTCC2155 TaxID=313628 RepID=A6DS30_9BACT|nr:prepilin peptidase [Lentisphaera araneosa]EDM25605.1 prepilin peptidase [Lentisphaera araneosa HTCC2155]
MIEQQLTNLFYDHFFFVGAFFTFVVGCCVGSFLNVVIWRLPLGMSLSVPGSHCPMCKTEIKLYDNVPILGWLVLKGKCRACKVSISPRYLVIEAVTGLMWLAVMYAGRHYDLPLSQTLLALIATSILVAASLTDIETRTIPIQLVYFGLATAFILALAFPESQLLGHDHKLFETQPVYSALNGFNPRLRSLFHCLFNVSIAYSFMFLCAKLGRKVFGSHTIECDPPVQVRLRKDNCQAEDDEALAWTEILSEKDEKIRFFTCENQVVEVNRKGFATKDGLDYKIDEEQKIFINKLTFPSAVIGGGDLSLITLCAAFVGIQGALVSLGFASLFGMIYLMISKKEAKMTQRAIPFAPFIAIFVWSWFLLWPFYIEQIRILVKALRT